MLGANRNYPTVCRVQAEQVTPQGDCCRYEKVTGSSESEVLRELNAFLGLDPAPPGADTLGHMNNKKGRRAKGWSLLQRQYEYLVELVRPDAQR